MKPRDLFLFGLETHVVPRLVSLGFRFRRSRPDFERIVGEGVRQRVHFQLSRWDTENQCEFWSHCGTSAPAYVEWYRAQWAADTPSDVLVELADWNIPGWSRGPHQHFVLSNREADIEEWGAFIENVERVGLPFLQRVSTWAGAAEQARDERVGFDRAADFLLIGGNRARAHAVLLEGIETLEGQGRLDQIGEVPRLRARLERYFGTSSSA